MHIPAATSETIERAQPSSPHQPRHEATARDDALRAAVAELEINLLRHTSRPGAPIPSQRKAPLWRRIARRLRNLAGRLYYRVRYTGLRAWNLLKRLDWRARREHWRQWFEMSQRNNRGPDGRQPIAFYPCNRRTRRRIKQMLSLGAIRPGDWLVVDDNDDALPRWKNVSQRVLRFSELPDEDVQAVYLLDHSAELERSLAELEPDRFRFSINDHLTIGHVHPTKTMQRPYRKLRMQYSFNVVVPLHYSNYAYLQYLKSIVTPEMQVIDAFAGPGTVGLSLAKECGLREITLFDLNPESAEMIRRNVAANFGDSIRAHVFESNLFQAIPPDRRYDLIVGNPPHNLDTEQTNAHLPLLHYIQAHDPGMKIHREFFAQARHRLQPGGRICLLENGEAGCITIDHIRELLADFPELELESHQFMPGSQFYVFTAIARECHGVDHLTSP